MKTLYPSFVNPRTWRCFIKEKITRWGREKIRLKILERDNYTCCYCGFRAKKGQVMHHIDGNPNNNAKRNLEIMCPMCSLIHHAGLGCTVLGVVDLYKKSKYTQNEIIRITRRMRLKGKNDNKIIKKLGLKEKVPFKTDRNYLKKLFGFVTSRKARPKMEILKPGADIPFRIYKRKARPH